MYGTSVKRILNGIDMAVATPQACSNPLVHLPGKGVLGKEYFDMTENDMLTGIQFCGVTGAGKTYLEKKVISQLRKNLGAPYSMVIVQAKDDFSHISRPGDLLICQGKDSVRSVKWNLFNDILADGYDMNMIKLNTRQFVKHIFADKKESKEKFFVNGAEEFLYCVIISYIREGITSLKARQKLNNKGLLDFFLSYSEDKYEHLLKYCEEPGALKMILGEKTDNRQGLGVLGEAVTTVLQIFIDVFAEDGDFSIRKFIKNKDNKALFINYDPSYKDTQFKIFGSLIDFMIKECLAQDSMRGKTILLCDELPAIGKMDIASAVNLGRAKGLIAMCGFQSVEQLVSIYGENEAMALMAGLRTKIMFSPNDKRTRDYLKECFGKCIIEDMVLSPGGTRRERREGYVIEDADVTAMHDGECYIRKPDGSGFKFSFE